MGDVAELRAVSSKFAGDATEDIKAPAPDD